MPRPSMPARTTTLPAFIPVLSHRPSEPPPAAAAPAGESVPRARPTANNAPSVVSKWAARATPGLRATGRFVLGPTGLLPCLLTSASTALCAQPWLSSAVTWSQRTAFIRHAAPLLGAHAGVAVIVTGLVLAATALAMLQLGRQRFGAPADSAVALLAAHAPQLALGLALAPMLTPLGLLGPAGGLVVASTVGLTVVLSAQRALGRAPSPMGAAAMLGACVLAGPPGWSVACGMAPQVAVAQSVAIYALWLTATAAVAAALSSLVHNAPTPYFDRGVLGPEALRPYRFERQKAAESEAATPGASAPPKGPAPTIFDVDPDVWALVDRLRPELPTVPKAPFMGFRGQPVCHLHGPAGGGKTRSTLGLAREIGAHYRATDANELEADRLGDLPVAAINACLLLLSADAHGRQVRRPVVLLVDEVDALLPSPDGEQDQARINKALGYSLFVHTLRLLQRNGSYVLLMTATNRFAAYEQMLQLLGQNGEVYLGAPGPASKGKVLAAGLHDTSLALRRNYGIRWAPLLDAEATEVDALVARCEAEGALSLRSMANLARVALEAGVGEAARQGEPGDRLGPARQALVRRAFGAMHAELDARREERETPQKQADHNATNDGFSPGDVRGAGPARFRADPPEDASRVGVRVELAPRVHGPQTHDEAGTRASQTHGGRRSRRADAQAMVNLDRLLQQTGLRDTSMVQVFQTIAENLAREYPKPENAVRFAELELRLANVFYLSLLHMLRAATSEAPPPLHHQVYVPEASGNSWLPSPSDLLAAGWRAAQAQVRANAVLRRAQAKMRRALARSTPG